MKKIFIILLIVTVICSIAVAQCQTVTGQIVNGNGTTEKCTDVKVRLYVNSEMLAETTPNETGHYRFDLSQSSAPHQSQPDDFTLNQNYPNPFNEQTAIPYTISGSGRTTLTIYDILGRKIRSLVSDDRLSGQYSAYWNGRSDTGSQCANGIYICVMHHAGHIEKRKMLLSDSQSLVSSFSLKKATASAQSNNQIMEIKFKSRAISDTSVTLCFDSFPETVEVGLCTVRVYPFVRGTKSTYSLMSGQSARDTLDIYHENGIHIHCENIDMDWHWMQSEKAVLSYNNISENMARLNIIDNRTGKIAYFKTYFDLSPRCTIWPGICRRAYPGNPYEHTLTFDGNLGNVHCSLIGNCPDGFTFSSNTLSGNPVEALDTILYFMLTDDRQIEIRDSVRLMISNPSSVTFNDYVLDCIEYYQRDGRFDYKWINGYSGVTQDLYYRGTRIANANPDGSRTSYCCGLTFENFFHSITFLNDDLGLGEVINNLSAHDMKHFLQLWFVTADPRRGPGLALETYGLGDQIHDFSDVLPGDFLQLWRTSGSGHSVIFIDWTLNTAGDTTGITYWSTQPSTDGINYNTEYFPDHGGHLDINHLYFSRVSYPEQSE